MGLPLDYKSLIEEKQKELSELKKLFQSICEHPNIEHKDFCGDGG